METPESSLHTSPDMTDVDASHHWSVELHGESVTMDDYLKDAQSLDEVSGNAADTTLLDFGNDSDIASMFATSQATTDEIANGNHSSKDFGGLDDAAIFALVNAIADDHSSEQATSNDTGSGEMPSHCMDAEVDSMHHCQDAIQSETSSPRNDEGLQDEINDRRDRAEHTLGQDQEPHTGQDVPPEIRAGSPSIIGDLEAEEYCEPRGLSIYGLRADANKWQTNFAGAEHDIDTTGDYDPDKPDAKPTIVRSLKRKVPSSDVSVSGSEEEKVSTSKRVRSKLAERQDGVSLPVMFKLVTPKQKEYQRSMGTESDNWPFDETLNKFADLPDDEKQRLLEETRRNTRREAAMGISEPVGPLHLGHPKARTCKKCMEGHQKCNLDKADAHYPCASCRADGSDCELLGVGLRKRACLHCLSNGLQCSNGSKDGDYDAPCSACATANVKCVAGLAIEPGRARISDVNWKPVEPSPEPRFYLPCTSCRRNQRSCSLLREPGPGPCDLCKKHGIECTFETLAKRAAAKKEAKKRQSEAKQIVIITRLSHPIKFHTAEADCTWCTKALYGLAGWKEEKQVTVEPSKDGSHYIEIKGGHCEAGKPASSMCSTCTRDRVKIMSCVSHVLKTMAEAPRERATAGSIRLALQSLHQCTTPAEVRKEMRKWCSLCRRPALAECERCKMRMCHTCCEMFLGMADGRGSEMQASFTKLVDTFAKKLYPDMEYCFGMRADLELLQINGLLFKAVAKRHRSKD